ncbi:hypothetical protein NAT51_02155 [Flavobacterium amniphilum]|uniref:hypothetical protein n=1 Tax=Flavobacterium amniphilum TaxID=1834035 RepID=UPI00202A7B27|nr:hypothetical protein [Flavobacterium amniphilum]MCL9804311.1 hypothetical protein [Flavobacterium amniphilum]
MFFNKVNIKDVLIRENSKPGHESSLLQFTQSVLDTNDSDQYTLVNKLYINKLENDKVFHIDTIRKICITYRLRFLNSKYYKLDIPEEANIKIRQLEIDHKTSLHSFKILATAKALKLKNYDDPLLFVPMGNDYYYLIYKWGNDLSPLRKWKALPYRNFGNLLAFILLLSIATTFMLPYEKLGTETYSTIKMITFLFIFKTYCAIYIYYFFWKGKHFSVSNWDSIYYN